MGKRTEIQQRFMVLGIIMASMAAIHIVNMVNGGMLSQFGVVPRVPSSLPYIFTAPFIHGGVIHLVNNLIGLAVFGVLCLLRSLRFFVLASIFIIFFSGLMTWLLGRSASHIGASGWIFGLWSLSIAMAYFDRSFKNIAIALFTIVFYGGMMFGVLPSRAHISFEMHLFGAIGGILFAFLYGRTKRYKINRQ
ncbi:rhomboid family intramembrane serine protease [Marinibactrum halimedae]|uniref:Rhomboid family intramembrane serine protease n=1 Tax=Marinibactrum halimedae TaxID=1444977 RepID=A0AA37WNQ8_9GAMM|nr:rhomboid family intramembrane serine protease [Marinibactrum halimedae]MCD9460154.1 rhomboid family intramembrane serine protease [Marinibactrum halimedae]GLS26376.1 rhomboid family intramembrane serine protease [Marinibactrum halimedae]